MGSLANRKLELRGRLKALRSQLDQKTKVEFDHRICERTLEWLDENPQPAHAVWTAYIPIQNEVNPIEIVEKTHAQILWAFPVIQNDEMKFYIPNKAQSFQKGRMGIQEPQPHDSQKMEPHEISGCLVPGLAFDKSGSRLGYGKGYYDKFLKTFKGNSIALAYSFQIIDEDLPREGTDIPVQYIVSEEEVITCTQEVT